MREGDPPVIKTFDAATVRSLLEQREEVMFAYLFGSHARGDVTTLSDLDIAVYFAEGDILQYNDLRMDLYLALSRGLGTSDIDLVVLNTVSNLMLLDEIIRCGIVLVDRDPDRRTDFEQRVLHQAIDFKTQRKAFLGV